MLGEVRCEGDVSSVRGWGRLGRDCRCMISESVVVCKS